LHRTRAFLYGESVFTSVRVEAGEASFYPQHRERLLKSAEWLWPNTTQQAKRLLDSLTVPSGSGVWRLTFTAQAQARSALPEARPELILDEWWSEEISVLAPMQVRLVECAPRLASWPAFLKAGEYLSRLVAARGLLPQEIPLFFVGSEICEFLHANVFVFDGKIWFTPPAGPNVLDGIGRARLLDMLTSMGEKVVQAPLTVAQLSQFPHMIAVNAVRGVIPVATIDSRPVLGHPILAEIQNNFFLYAQS
jgi:branched-subunit amino acid aminotransferase/4-amino-4-deoxychorismate lyase